MLVRVIKGIDQFDELKTTWNEVYSADPQAQIFLSWSWLRGWFEVTPHEWFVLALQPDRDSPYVAFLPLAISPVQKYGLNIFDILHMGGNDFADYTGFVCPPEYEEEALYHFAQHIKERVKWEYFEMRDVLDSRMDKFLQYFYSSEEQFTVEKNTYNSCPYIPLPDSWEEYLQTFLGSKSRKNLRYALRQFEAQSQFKLVEINIDNLGSQIEALLTLWQMQWGDKPESRLNIYRSLFQKCGENNSLWLSVIWDGKIPIAATGMFVDHLRKTTCGYMTGYHPDYSKFSPGRVMMAYSIQKAIANNFKVYDFLRGDEDYKFSFFGAKQRFNYVAKITRRNMRVTGINWVRNIRDSFVSV